MIIKSLGFVLLFSAVAMAQNDSEPSTPTQNKPSPNIYKQEQPVQQPPPPAVKPHRTLQAPRVQQEPVVASASENYGSAFGNIQSIIDKYNFRPYYSQTPVKRVKIAVFDYGFFGYEKAKEANLLPADLVFVAPKIKADPTDKDESHGNYEAQIVQALMTNEGHSPQFAPQFYFYYVSGHTNFKEAITDAIDKKVDIIMYPAVREYGSNWDGKGFWNKEVNRATSAGIIWINAAGNYGRLTYNSSVNSSVVTGSDAFVKLPDEHNTLAMTCAQAAQGDGCHAKIILSWSDFKDDVDQGTDQDLDLAILDSTGKVVGQSSLKQVKDTTNLAEGNSLYPREMVDIQVEPGDYFIQVKDNSGNFKPSNQLRIVIAGDFLTLNHFQIAESLLPPADNPNVITIGALDDKATAVSVKLLKPEQTLDSMIVLNDRPDNPAYGNSNSVAIATAGYGVLLTLLPGLSKQTLLEYTSSPRGPHMNSEYRLPDFK